MSSLQTRAKILYLRALCYLRRFIHTCMQIADKIISWDSSIGIAARSGLDDWVRFLAGARDFSLLHSIQTSSGDHPASYPVGIRGSFPRDKATGA
jgi:hypothetical protein